MSKKLYEEGNIQAIADAIREKNGEETSYKVSQMAQAILNIDGGTGDMPNLDLVSFGNNPVVDNPGYTDPRYYEDIADAINYAVEHGGGGNTNIHYGIDIPDNAVGSNGDIYLKHNPTRDDYSYIPSGYKPLAYIQSLAVLNNYIDTGVYPTEVKRLDIDLLQPEDSEHSSSFIGSCPDYANGNYGMYIEWDNNAKKISALFGSGRNVIRTNHAYDYKRHIYSLIDNGDDTFSFYEDGTLQGTNPISATNNTYTLWIFRNHHNYGNNYARPSKMQFFGAKLYDYNDELIRNYVPVRRLSDDKIGVYDVVNDEFNEGGSSSDFTGGAELGRIELGRINNVFIKINNSWKSFDSIDIDDIIN